MAIKTGKAFIDNKTLFDLTVYYFTLYWFMASSYNLFQEYSMYCSHTYTIALLVGVIAFSAVDAAKPRVTIINNTPKPLQVDLTIPEETEAQIKLKKLNQPQSVKTTSQDLLYRAIVNDSVADIKKAIQAGADINYTKDCNISSYVCRIS